LRILDFGFSIGGDERVGDHGGWGLAGGMKKIRRYSGDDMKNTEKKPTKLNARIFLDNASGRGHNRRLIKFTPG